MEGAGAEAAWSQCQGRIHGRCAIAFSKSRRSWASTVRGRKRWACTTREPAYRLSTPASCDGMVFLSIRLPTTCGF
ncbi:MAG: hypothetical protein ACK55Z_10745 [bacterium]